MVSLRLLDLGPGMGVTTFGSVGSLVAIPLMHFVPFPFQPRPKSQRRLTICIFGISGGREWVFSRRVNRLQVWVESGWTINREQQCSNNWINNAAALRLSFLFIAFTFIFYYSRAVNTWDDQWDG